MLLRQAHFGQPIQDDLADFRVVVIGMLAQRKGHVLSHRHAVEQSRALKHETETNSLASELSFGETGQILPVEQHFALRGSHQPDQAL